MVKTGRITRLRIGHLDDRGAWLETGGEPILLPKKELPPEAEPGSEVEVFVLTTAAGLQATVRRPFVQVGEFALLRVSEVSRFGAFMEWGLEKELLVPFREQPAPLQEGRSYLIRVRLDQAGRIVGSARVDRWLEPAPAWYRAGQAVEMLIWTFTDLGAKVIVNHAHEGLLYREELPDGLKPGDALHGTIQQVRDDGKLDLTLRKVGREAVQDARATILAALREQPHLPLHDGSTPEEIRDRLGLSKKQFKKALGGLYKEGRVELLADGVRWVPGRGPAKSGTSSADKEDRDRRSRRRQKRNGPRSGRGEKS